MPWRMHPPRKEQAFFLLPMTGSKWIRSHGLSNSASMSPVYLLLKLLHEVSLLALRMFCSRHIPKRERTILGYHCRVCDNSTPARGALDWLRSTICSGPPSSHPSDLVRVGHQMLHESHRLRFHRGVYWCTSCGQLPNTLQARSPELLGLVNE